MPLARAVAVEGFIDELVRLAPGAYYVRLQTTDDTIYTVSVMVDPPFRSV